MKIAFIGGRTFHHPDGIATFMYNLATELTEMGHEPIVYCESDHNGEEWVNGFKVVHQKSYKNVALNKILLGLKATCKSLFFEKNVNVFHYNGWAPSLLSARLPWLFGRVSILQGHGLEWKRTKYSHKQQKKMKFMEKVTAHLNCNLTMCSQEQTDFFKNEYGLNCRTITGAVNLPRIQQRSNILERFGIRENSYILFMGRLVQDKNPDYLIKGFTSSNFKEKQLVLCGDNPQSPDYVLYLRELASDCPNVVFTGSVFDADKDTIFRSAWAYCLPSTLEGLPISLLEAMSYGKICIASDIKANKEALGESGIWVRPENAEDITTQLENLYEHYENFVWQKEANQKRCAEFFSWENKATEYISFVNDIKNKKYSKRK
jgi:glycosyltransferase involved in cell wall biosynthesis